MHDVRNNEAARRFEITIDGHTGFLQYARTADRLELLHTDVPAELGGRGLGGTLATAALETARHDGLRVIARCPFVRNFVARHPEYATLVDSADR